MMASAPVRRKDGELLGWTRAHPKGVLALSPFGCPLAMHEDEDDAAAWLHAQGLAILARPWVWFDPAPGAWFQVELQELGTSFVVLRIVDHEHPERGEYRRLGPKELGGLMPLPALDISR